MAPELTHLLWIDLETTGTDEKLDPIIEVAVILTDMRLYMVDGFERSWAATLSGDAMGRLSDNDYVRDMHTANGLLDDCLRIGLDLPLIDRRLCDLLADAGVGRHRLMLAGSGVGHFDRRFVRQQLPLLESYLQYPVIDIGVVRRFAREICGFEPPDFTTSKTHRAVDDVRLHLAEARWWRQNMMGLFERIHR